MFNFEEGKISFNSVEEVKEFLLSTDDINVLGAICFANPDGDVQQEIPIGDFIEQVGIDKVAEMLFEITQESQPELLAISREEVINLLEKANRGEELTEEETRKLSIVSAAMDGNKDKMDQRRDSLYNGITMTLVQSKNMPLFNTIGGNLALATTYLECAIVTSDEKLRRAFSNSATADDVANTAASKIHVDEDISPELAILGMLHKIGEMATNIKEIREKPMNFEDIVNTLELDEDWIFNPDKKISSSIESVTDILDKITNGSNKNESEDFSEEKENGSNTNKPENVVDIRNRLRRK